MMVVEKGGLFLLRLFYSLRVTYIAVSIAILLTLTFYLTGTNTSVLRMNVHFADRFENAFFDGIGFYFGDG